jgi:uncharacterized cupredoxin-like copper-binding protein
MRRTLIVFVAVGVAALTAWGAEGMAGSVKTTRIAVTLNEYSIKLSKARTHAGNVVFKVTNRGAEVHEFVVLKTRLPAAHLPLKAGEVQEEKIEPASQKKVEVENVLPGKSKTLKTRLAPGHYVLICNEPGHYMHGMHTALWVVP